MKTNLLLAVDDKPDNLYVLQSLIGQYLPNCKMLVASSAKEGLDAAAESDLDGALIDVQMPGMGGVEMCRRLKDNEKTAHVPVILITAHRTDAKIRAEGLRAGADDFLTKPVDNLELVAKVKVMLRIKRAQDELRNMNAHLEQLVDERTQALRTSNERFRVALKNSTITAFHQDNELRYTWVHNPKSDLSTESVLGKTDADLVSPEDAVTLTEIKRRVMETGVGERNEVRFTTKRKEPAFYDLTVEPLQDPDGHIVGITGASLDITERKRLEKDLRQAQKMEAIGQLAGGVAHDFNNILQAMGGYADFALKGMDPETEQCTDLREIKKGIDRAATLTRQLLAFSRQQVLRLESVDLNSLINDLMKMLRRVIGENIEMNVRLGDDISPIHADLGQIEQILMNLAINARDAMPEGGTVNIDTENTSIGTDYCKMHLWAREGRYVILTVSDTGCGMDEETRNKLFDPFFTTKETGKGTGLGLSTVYGIVKQHEGLIHVYSEIGKGATFKVYLPLADQPSDEHAETSAQSPPAGGTETILFAEDDESVRKIVTRFLKKAGYTVLNAVDGKDAIEVVTAHADEIALVILDVVMPKLSGQKVFERIKEINPGMRVLFSSGYSPRVLNVRFGEGAQPDLIQKPYQPEDLLRQVRKTLDSDG